MAEVEVGLAWTGEGLVFEGGAPGGPRHRLESGGETAASPTQALLLSAAACSAIDVVDILEKMRVPLSSLNVVAEADRQPEPPRYFTAMRIRFQVGVPADAASKVERAVELSRDKYCSVLQSLRPDMDLTTEIELV